LFAAIPAGAPIPPVAVTPSGGGPARLIMEDRVELPRLYLAWPTPGLFEPGDAELDLVSDLVANGRTSRLYGRLIHDRRIAVELAAGQTSRELGGTFQVVASAAPGHTLDELEAAVYEEIARFGDEGPTDAELTRGRMQAESAFVFRVEALGGFGGKADQLNAYNIYRGNPDCFQADLDRYLGATRDALRNAVSGWLGRRAAVTLAVVPQDTGMTGLSDAKPVERASA